MAKKAVTESKEPASVQRLPGDLLPEEAHEALARHDEETLLEIAVREAWQGRPQVTFLMRAHEAYAKYKPLADSFEQVDAELAKVNRHLAALKRYVPESVAEVSEYAETLHETQRQEARLSIKKGEANRAREYCNFIRYAFMKEPPRASCCHLRQCPSELEGWYKEHRVDSYEPHSWMEAGPTAEFQPRPIVAKPAAMNVRQEGA